ncbi:MAG: PEPxxWA-CTERM sorting domain-containing protein [Proteobacteria bacterium]|nr:PEPxxWA-CTERM sorting domain-containing protein [Pseudomonadota bacterium]
MLKSLLTVTAFSVAALSAPASAAVVSGFNSTLLPAQDDQATGPQALGFIANFFGNSRTATYISSNGYVTFNTSQDDYTPVGLGASYTGQPIIAAFYADVDNEEGGTIGYGSGTFNGRAALGVTWNEVGVYGGTSDDKRNTFQLLLVDRADTGAGNFDIVFNYDKIQWETGSAGGSNGTNGLGGNSASVGYNAGTGGQANTFFQLAGSQTPGSFIDGRPFALASNSNVGIAGRYLFQVRDGNVTPPPGVPEPASWAMMIGGFGLLGAAVRRARRTTVVLA